MLARANVLYDVEKLAKHLPATFPGYLIRSSRRLGMEGLRQRHCVASYHGELASGPSAIGAVFVDGKRPSQRGDDDDTLYGEDGLDTLLGGAGADTFVFEDVTAFNDVDVVSDFDDADDALDIADILDGYYTYGVDTLTDVVQITDNGTDSTLYRPKRRGHSFVAVASILRITSLTNETALETSGH